MSSSASNSSGNLIIALLAGVVVGLILGLAVAVVVGVLVGVLVGVALYLALRPKDNQPQARKSDVRFLRPGDVVDRGGELLEIVSSYQFSEDGSSWQEHRSDDGKWLSVETEDGLELAWWTEIVAPELEPGAPRITYEGTEYVKEEHGHADYSFHEKEEVGIKPQKGRVEYYDYQSADGKKFLAFERYGESDFEVSVGFPVSEFEIEVYAAGYADPA